MKEQSKAALRRVHDQNFLDRFFVGAGLDLGPGNDPINPALFPAITRLDTMDIGEGDAQTLSWKDGRPDTRDYDFIHASHVLEHLPDPFAAFNIWIDSIRPGGHLIIVVPDEDLYEQQHWPSWFSTEHLHTFTIFKSRSWSPVSINFLDMLRRSDIRVERLILHRDHWNPDIHTDQSLGPAECAIEVVLKRLPF